MVREGFFAFLVGRTPSKRSCRIEMRTSFAALLFSFVNWQYVLCVFSCKYASKNK